MMTGRIFGLTRQQKAARLKGEKSISLTSGQTAALRRHGHLTRADEWYASPCGWFALAPGDPGAPWGEGRRERISLRHESATGNKAA